jgi:rubrerythrin
MLIIFKQKRSAPSCRALCRGERETTYYVCQVCGYVSDGVLPEVCPVCSAPKDQFVESK